MIPRTMVRTLCVLHSPEGTWTLEGRISALSGTPVFKPEIIKYIYMFECSFFFIHLPSLKECPTAKYKHSISWRRSHFWQNFLKNGFSFRLSAKRLK
jgi:hypothetical protein